MNEAANTLGARMEEIPTIADFRAPPVVEVVCGVQFQPLAEFRSAHAGLFWQRVRDTYTVARDVPALPPVIENFGAPTAPGLAITFSILGFGQARLPRVQLVDSRGGQMIQIQNGRFHHNWEKQHGADEYRRYKAIRPAFVERWEQFKAFVTEQGLGVISATQYELSYINHIAAGGLWDQKRGLGSLLPWLAPPYALDGDAFEPEFAMHAPVPMCRGRLHVTGKIGLRAGNATPILAMELTVRGAPVKAGEDGDIVSWMDVARDRIVRTFVKLTSEEARQHWGQTK
jgi:uncharacterized protein (TIGR04255 family)